MSKEEANGEKRQDGDEKELVSGPAFEAADETVFDAEAGQALAAGHGQGLTEEDREVEPGHDPGAGISSPLGAGQEGGAEPDEAPPGAGDLTAGADASVAAGRLKGILEALIFCSESPLSLERMVSLVEGADRREVKRAVEELVLEYRDRQGGLEIVEVAGGFQVRTRPELAPWVAKLRQQKPARLSRAALEALAIVAYRQPVTRAEIEAIRGVDCAAAIGSLLEKKLIRIVGRKEVPGRPILYGTTQEFLELFGLKNLKSLPTLREIEGMFAEAKPEERQPEPAAVSEASDGAGVGWEEAQPSCRQQDAGDPGRGTEGQAEDGISMPAEDEEGEEEEGIDGGGRETLDDAALRKAMDDVLRKTKTRFVRYEEVFPKEAVTEGQEGEDRPMTPGVPEEKSDEKGSTGKIG